MYILSTNLLYLMNKDNINKNQLSKIISVGPSVVGKWVNDEITELKLTNIASIATFFNVTIDDLVFSNIEMQKKLIEKYSDFEYIKIFKWNEKINLFNKNFQKQNL